MGHFRLLLVGLAMWAPLGVAAQEPGSSPGTLKVTTQLVVLDATVLDKNGQIVTQNLGRDDFSIEENKRPQTIYSFESAEEHLNASTTGDKEKSPHLIFVLDELNYAYQSVLGSSGNAVEQLEQYAYERGELMKFLRDQPRTLRAPTEVLILREHGYQILVQATLDRDAVEARVQKHDPGLGQPFRLYLEETTYGDYTLTRTSCRPSGRSACGSAACLGASSWSGLAMAAPTGCS